MTQDNTHGYMTTTEAKFCGGNSANHGEKRKSDAFEKGARSTFTEGKAADNNHNRKKQHYDSAPLSMEVDGTNTSLHNKFYACGVLRVTQEELDEGLSTKRRNEILKSLELIQLPFCNDEICRILSRYGVDTPMELLRRYTSRDTVRKLPFRLRQSVENFQYCEQNPRAMAAFLSLCQRRMRTKKATSPKPIVRKLAPAKLADKRRNSALDGQDTSTTSPTSSAWDDSSPLHSQQDSDESDAAVAFKPTRRKQATKNSSTSSTTTSPDVYEPEAELDDDDDDDGGLMEEIPHLSKTTIDKETGYPIREFSVLDHHETMYKFRISVKQSTIPGGGRGAFLTFLGAWVLKPEYKERSDKKMVDRLAYIPDTMNPLEAQMPDGYGITVKLTGANLHGNYNKLYWPQTMFPLKAVLPNTYSNGNDSDDSSSGRDSPRQCGRKHVSVKLKGEKLHYDSEDEEEYMTNVNRVKPIGFLGLFVKNDFIPCSKSFSSERCCYIDLGRYGPLLKTDRKTKTEFDVKDFVFNHEPSFWNFGVDETLHGEEQIIDVTSDETGEPHEFATHKADMMMYVNEVGYSTELQQNVRALEKDGRSVHYYLDVSTPLRKNQTVELLVDYHAPYEPSRERKGYGERNLEEGLRGDDHEPTRLQRNFVERKHTEAVVSSMALMDLYDMVEYLHTKLWEPVESATTIYFEYLQFRNTTGGEQSADETTVHRPSILQWCARRRLHWLSEILGNRVYELEKESEMLGKRCADVVKTFPYRGILNDTKKRLGDMQWNSVDQTLASLNDTGNNYEKKIYDTISFEMSEEMLYSLSDCDLLDPLDESRWCPVAIQLTKNLCKGLFSQGTADCHRLVKAKLGEIFLSVAQSAAETVRQTCQSPTDNSIKQLQFPSGTKRGSAVNISHAKRYEAQIGSNPLSRQDPPLPKGVLAAMFEIQSYRDALEVGLLEENFDLKRLLVPTDGVFVFTKSGSSASGDSPSRSCCMSHSIPRKTEDVTSGRAVLDEQWYIVWQVVYVVHKFASKFLARDLGSEKVYSLEQLCKATGVSIKDIDGFDIAMEPLVHLELPEFSHCRRSLKPKGKKVPLKHASKAGPRPKPALFYGTIWKTLETLGWKRDVGNRPRDFYFLPPGVSRGKGFSPRIDYFDSLLLVLNFVRTDPRWKDRDEVVSSLKLYESCLKVLDDLKFKRKLPKGQVTVEWLVSQANKNKS